MISPIECPNSMNGEINAKFGKMPSSALGLSGGVQRDNSVNDRLWQDGYVWMSRTVNKLFYCAKYNWKWDSLIKMGHGNLATSVLDRHELNNSRARLI